MAEAKTTAGGGGGGMKPEVRASLEKTAARGSGPTPRGLHIHPGACMRTPVVLMQAVAHEIIGAAECRFGHMDPEQLPHHALGVLRAGASRLAKVEGREAGRVLPGGLAAQAQVGAR